MTPPPKALLKHLEAFPRPRGRRDPFRLPLDSLQGWSTALQTWGQEVCVRALLAAARLVAPGAAKVDRAWIDQALAAAEAWIASPTEPNRKAAFDLFRAAKPPASHAAPECCRAVAVWVLLAVAGKYGHAAGVGLGVAGHALFLATGGTDKTHVFFTDGGLPHRPKVARWAAFAKGRPTKDVVRDTVRAAIQG
jgi:hypothetical protein